MLRGIVWPSLSSPRYTPGEKKLWRGKLSSRVSALSDEMLAVDLAGWVTELALPAYFFHGVYDYTVNYQLAKDYVEALKAPLKGFYTFDKSAHSPMMEEPQKPRDSCVRMFLQERTLSLTIPAGEETGAGKQ